jgi:hypothetical protein
LLSVKQAGAGVDQNGCMDKRLFTGLKRYVLPCLLSLSMIQVTDMAAADDSRQGRFYFGGDLGAARMNLQSDGLEYSDMWLFGALRAEYALQQQLLLGLEGAGWTDQAEVDSSISEDLLTLMLTARVYPVQSAFVFLKAGWGYAKHRYWESSTQGDTSGTGYLVGIGYDYYVTSLSLSYSGGDLEQESYRAITFSVGFTF